MKHPKKKKTTFKYISDPRLWQIYILTICPNCMPFNAMKLLSNLIRFVEKSYYCQSYVSRVSLNNNMLSASLLSISICIIIGNPYIHTNAYCNLPLTYKSLYYKTIKKWPPKKIIIKEWLDSCHLHAIIRNTCSQWFNNFRRCG